jgi:hypothetical protein
VGQLAVHCVQAKPGALGRQANGER